MDALFPEVFLSARDVRGGWAVTVPGEGLRVQARVAQWVWATCSSTVHPTFSWTPLHVSDSWVSCCVAGREWVEVLGVCQWRPARCGPRHGRRRSPGPAGRSTSAARRSGVGESAPTRDPGMLAPAQAQPCHLHPSAFLNPVSERSRAGPPKALRGGSSLGSHGTRVPRLVLPVSARRDASAFGALRPWAGRPRALLPVPLWGPASGLSLIVKYIFTFQPSNLINDLYKSRELKSFKESFPVLSPSVFNPALEQQRWRNGQLRAKRSQARAGEGRAWCLGSLDPERPPDSEGTTQAQGQRAWLQQTWRGSRDAGPPGSPAARRAGAGLGPPSDPQQGCLEGVRATHLCH